jgi:hypothetical protein
LVEFHREIAPFDKFSMTLEVDGQGMVECASRLDLGTVFAQFRLEFEYIDVVGKVILGAPSPGCYPGLGAQHTQTRVTRASPILTLCIRVWPRQTLRSNRAGTKGNPRRATERLTSDQVNAR